MDSPLWIAVFYFSEFVRDGHGKWNWKQGDNNVVDGLDIVTEISYKELYGKLLDLCIIEIVVDGLEIVTEISYKELYGKLLDLCNINSLELRFLLPGDALFAEPIQEA
ncbi:hypothetical protein Fot_05669 [Forsythia ovata]|uniref:Uncharacterized protein n=1 Tax=Forsythia ovata TaxID=205694 RepID=A0ABD1WUS7_9LAMI